MAGLIPASFTNRMFKSYLDKSYISSGSGSTQRIDPGTGMWVVCIQMQGSNNDHMSVYLHNQSSAYAKKVQQLSNYNYNGNTSITVSNADSGTGGFVITANYTSLYGGRVQVFLFQLI